MQAQPISDVQVVRQINRGAVLELLRRQGPMPRTAIARATRLTAPTCFSIVDDLVSSDLARCVATSRGSAGRPRAIFEFNPDAAYSLGIDLSGDSFVGVLIDLSGRVLETRRGDRPDPSDVEPVVDWVASFVGEIRRAATVDLSRLAGIGVAVPALFDVNSQRVVRSTNLNWGEVRLSELLSAATGADLYLENTARSMALCERWFGAGRDTDHMLCVNIGMGIGMGMIIDGRLHVGPYAHSGELGHTLVDPSGPLCRCGRRGCLEAVAAGGAIRREVVRALSEGRTSAILERAGGDLCRVTPEMVALSADDGDPLAVDAVERAARQIGVAISNAVTVLNPTLVVLSGFLVHSSRLLFDIIADTVRDQVLASPNRQGHVPVARAQLGPLAAAVGAAGVVHQRRIGLYDGVRLEAR